MKKLKILGSIILFFTIHSSCINKQAQDTQNTFLLDPFINLADSIHHYSLNESIKDSLTLVDSLTIPYYNRKLIVSRGYLTRYNSELNEIINCFKVKETPNLEHMPCEGIYGDLLQIFYKNEILTIVLDFDCERIVTDKIFAGQLYFGQKGEFSKLRTVLFKKQQR